jgi:hypothetical protein
MDQSDPGRPPRRPYPDHQLWCLGITDNSSFLFARACHHLTLRFLETMEVKRM